MYLPATFYTGDYIEQNHNSCPPGTNPLQPDQSIRGLYATVSVPRNILHYSTSCGMKRIGGCGWILSAMDGKVLTRYHICGHRGSFRFTRYERGRSGSRSRFRRDLTTCWRAHFTCNQPHKLSARDTKLVTMRHATSVT